MAYQVRRRDPLFDRGTQAVIERRGKELLGLCLLALAAAAALILGSYSPEDPSWLAASDEPVHNLLGRFGASVAQTAFVILGRGCWVLPLACAVWGGRLLAHLGEENVPGRSLLTPVAVVVASVFAAGHVPGGTWTHSFGMGGLLGDTILGAMLSALPLGSAFGLKVLSVLLAALTVASVLFVLGFTMPELRRIGRFLLTGSIMAYAAIARGAAEAAALLWKGGNAAGGQVAQALAARRAARAEAAALAAEEEALAEHEEAAWQPALRRDRAHAEEPAPVTSRPVIARRRLEEPPVAAPRRPVAAVPRPSVLSRVPSFLKRQAQPAPVEAEPALDAPEAAADPISARIARAISDRMRRAGASQARAEPPVERPKGPRPIVLDKNYYPAGGPPLRRSAAVAEAPVEDALARPHRPLTAEPLFETEEEAAPEVLRTDTTMPAPVIPESRKVVQSLQKRPLFPSRQARAEAQPGLAFEDQHPGYEPPPLSLLADPASVQRHHLSEDALGENARLLESVLDDYGVKGEIVSVRPGPVVTMYELEPAPGLKASRVIGLADDIARSMEALAARVSTVPGRSVIGIELPNQQREKVVLREILASRDFGDTNMRLPLALGKDIGGAPVVANLAKMPHLLIAGTTGSGKSVAINTMILSLLYKLTPDECRLIMIDPKMLELSVYDGIPHLLSPVVTDPKKAVVALKWVVGEMEERYRKMSRMGVRNIEGYNDRVRDALSRGEMFSRTVQTGFDEETGEPTFETDEFQPEVLPFIVVVVDEMADLMMVAGKEIEACIQRLAQMARASGIHLIMATQRPSVDVITGTIKANFPTRISFQVTSRIDSRTILGEMGAEQLLGMGDMLYMAGGGRIVRVHGPFVSDEEVEEIVNHLKSFGPPDYVGGVIDGPDNDDRETSIDEVLGLASGAEGDDALYDMAVAIVAKDRKCSTSYIQRKLAIGYNKAARLVEAMETNGVVSPANQVGRREVLVPEPQ